MTARYITPNKQLTFEVTGATQAEVFQQLAEIQEVFSAETNCGCCHNVNLRYAVRHVDGNDFYELHCIEPKCRARFTFGQMKTPKGTLFPKRKDKEGNWLPDRGWSRYVAPASGSNTSQQREAWE